jgi:alpha-galactosidase
LPYAWELCGLEGYHFDAADRHRAEQWEWVRRIAEGAAPAPRVERPIAEMDGSEQRRRGLLCRSGEFALPIIVALVTGQEASIPAINVRNDRLIPNLPDWAIVEVPGRAGTDGLRGVPVGPLPAGVVAICNTQLGVQDLTVEAAVHGSRELALQALLADPVVQSADAAERTLDALLAIHAPYLPAFRGEG